MRLKKVACIRAALIFSTALVIYHCYYRYYRTIGASRAAAMNLDHASHHDAASHASQPVARNATIHANLKMDMEMMPMYFNVDFPAHILFKLWAPKNDGEMVGAVIAVFFMAVSFEALKKGRKFLYVLEAQRRNALIREGELPSALGGAVSSAPPSLSQRDVCRGMVRGMFRPFHLLQTLLQGVQFVLGYFLMLSAMTFSVWLFLGMVFGTMVGYFLFHWSPVSGNGYSSFHDDHCH
ncbi:hypothetical protein BV898_04916 [Hypsibius exemplaris]|uniref:Copper transport protein n=1 Tax=Hypsibius exemplaris TaxID=2072580 RepID=A0A1W0X124_HYPEX|nr:hypothetical protein BV898_04916 [Hypsibius exemplaris]